MSIYVCSDNTSPYCPKYTRKLLSVLTLNKRQGRLFYTLCSFTLLLLLLPLILIKLYSIFKSLKTLNFINHKYLSLYESVQTVIIISQMGRQRGSDTYPRINASLLKEDFKGHSLLTSWRKHNY